MLERLSDHIEILERKSGPYWIFSIGLLAAMIVALAYDHFIYTLYNTHLMNVYPFQKVIEDNLTGIQWGFFIIPSLVVLAFTQLAFDTHKKNYERIYGKGSWDWPVH